MKNFSNSQNNIINQFVDKKIINALASLLSDNNSTDISQQACIVADAFGADGSFSTLAANNTERDAAEQKLLTGFQNNISLLVQKTWIEQSDEALRDQVLYRIKLFCNVINQKDYSGAYAGFVEILHDVVYLMFGMQSQKDDFAEYALRIDPEFGVFWWYVQSLPENTTWNTEKYRIVLLLGMFFLANY